MRRSASSYAKPQSHLRALHHSCTRDARHVSLSQATCNDHTHTLTQRNGVETSNNKKRPGERQAKQKGTSAVDVRSSQALHQQGSAPLPSPDVWMYRERADAFVSPSPLTAPAHFFHERTTARNTKRESAHDCRSSVSCSLFSSASFMEYQHGDFTRFTSLRRMPLRAVKSTNFDWPVYTFGPL